MCEFVSNWPSYPLCYLLIIILAKSKSGSGLAFIEFSTVEEATRALHAMNGQMLPEKGRLLRLQFSRPNGQRPAPARRTLSTRLSQRERSYGEGVGF